MGLNLWLTYCKGSQTQPWHALIKYITNKHYYVGHFLQSLA